MRSLLVLALLPLTFARSVELHHRIITSSNEPSWIPLGSVEVDSSTFGNTALQPWGAKADKLDLSDDAVCEGPWYQVGVEGDDGWIYGSTRACFLSTPPRIQLHLSHDRPTSLSIKTNAPLTGKCPPVTAGGLTISPLGIKVDVQRPIQIAGPNPAAAPAAQPTNPTTGLPEAPPPEKTFLQKYWLPLLGIGIFIIGQMTAPEQQQGGARAAAK